MFYWESFYIDYLCVFKVSIVGIWFVIVVIVYGIFSYIVLWDYKVLDDIFCFVCRDLIFCGVLELFSIVNDSEIL